VACAFWHPARRCFLERVPFWPTSPPPRAPRIEQDPSHPPAISLGGAKVAPTGKMRNVPSHLLGRGTDERDCHGRQRGDEPKSADLGFIGKVKIDPYHRRYGYGMHALGLLAAIAREEGYRLLKGEVERDTHEQMEIRRSF
jgi:hypothetical protein